MKKILAVFICLIQLLCLVACGSGGENGQTEAVTVPTVQGEGFRVGFGRAYITPQENLPLGGYGTAATRIMADVLDEVYVDCIAMTDENNETVLLMLVDLQRIEDSLIAELRASVTAATGIASDRIFISCSHTHSIPDLTWNSHEGIIRYKELLKERFAASAVDAIVDSLPATMSSGSIETDQLSFVKHYSYVDENGQVQYFGDNFGTAVLNETTRHVTDGNETMQVLRFDREGGKPVVICNFQAHPHLTGGSAVLDLSSDYVGPFRDAVEWELDVHCSFIQGAGGNLNESSRILTENMGPDVTHREYGNRLAEYCIECLEKNMSPIETGPLQCSVIPFEARVDHSEDNKLAEADYVTAFHKNSSSASATREYAAQFGISSQYHASAIRYRYGLGETQIIELGAISIGNTVGFYVAPGELFAETGLEMEARSPFPMTIAVTLADGDWKYFPYGPCANYNSYESDYCRFEDGTTEQMMERWLTEFNMLYNNAK